MKACPPCLLLDLTGLPPTPDEIDAFLKDDAAQGYERLVDRLLQSERYGERWARHWLDLVRFAESGGYEFDKDRPGAYYYRDFVIRALNADMPFDEFVRLQVAGDQLKPGDLSATAATGFLVAGPFPGQTTAKTNEPIRYDHLDDMVSTLGTSLLGLSVGHVPPRCSPSTSTTRFRSRTITTFSPACRAPTRPRRRSRANTIRWPSRKPRKNSTRHTPRS